VPGYTGCSLGRGVANHPYAQGQERKKKKEATPWLAGHAASRQGVLAKREREREREREIVTMVHTACAVAIETR
jgi:hypothetical protein